MKRGLVELIPAQSFTSGGNGDRKREQEKKYVETGSAVLSRGRPLIPHRGVEVHQNAPECGANTSNGYRSVGETLHTERALGTLLRKRHILTVQVE